MLVVIAICWRLALLACFAGDILWLDVGWAAGCWASGFSTEANGHSWVLGMQTGDELLQLLQQLHGDARSVVECLYPSQARINLFLFFHINNIKYI